MAYRLFEPRNNIHKRHRVDVVIHDDQAQEYDYAEIIAWIKQNLQGGFYLDMPNRIMHTWRDDPKNKTVVPYYFVKQNDAALFKLRWG